MSPHARVSLDPWSSRCTGLGFDLAEGTEKQDQTDCGRSRLTARVTALAEN